MEESLLAKGIKEEKRKPETPSLTWVTFTGELKRLGFLAGPMVVVSLSQYLLQVISLMMVGHLDELALSSTALAISLSAVTGFSLLYSSACKKTLVPISKELFQGIGEFFRFAIPSAVMVCLEWWSFEFLILLSGLLPNPQLETSVLSVCLNTIATLYTIPYGLGAAASTRISNELGAGNPQAARVAVFAVLFLAVTETSIVSAILLASRSVFGYTFSNEKEVVDYVTTMAPLVSLSIILDSLQGVLSGVARGCGWQHIGAYVNLGAFYLCGIPVAAVLGFMTNLRGRGLWIGIQTGAFVQTVMLSIITSCINWEKQASNARERIFEGKLPQDNNESEQLVS
ncbi:protein DETOXIFICATION 12-like isoform X2 [Castanea sativa]|uniref:protein DETOXIFICATION 12-like isoform X2 n=1 Tax=Castanea sativa TaxID=21020 RepID=UPI003F652F38